MSERVSSLGRLARGVLGVALTGLASRGPLASKEMAALAEIVVTGSVIRRRAVPAVASQTVCENVKPTVANVRSTVEDAVKQGSTHVSSQVTAPVNHRETTDTETTSTSYRSSFREASSPAAAALVNPALAEAPRPTKKDTEKKPPVKRREVAVPSSPVARVLGFGQLAVGLAAGTFAEKARRAWRGNGRKTESFTPSSTATDGRSGTSFDGSASATSSSTHELDGTSSSSSQKENFLNLNDSVFLTEANAELLAVGLCRMRGAALKLGQMLSIQDESVVPPAIAKALERVREGADVMPKKQLLETIESHLGKNWRAPRGLIKDGGDVEVIDFNHEPMAAASIGQVHRATVKRRVTKGNSVGTTRGGASDEEHEFETLDVCMKIQYPGVARSIHSDIDNLVRMISYTDLIPAGLFVEHAVATAKEELTLECDYVYERESTDRMRTLLHDDPAWKTPRTVPELSSKGVLTTTFAPGVAIDKVSSLSQEIRDYVATQLLRGTLRELFEFRFMQSDPNFANFLFCETTGQLTMIDFGAAKEYPRKFVDEYLKMVVACAEKNRQGVIESSVKLGFLTGNEQEVLIDAHVEAGFQVGRPFQDASLNGSEKNADDVSSEKAEAEADASSHHQLYDFAINRDMTRRVAGLGKVMLKHRLTPPPSEAYSLHRKLSGSFLACMRLNAKVPARELLMDVFAKYTFDDDDVRDTNVIIEKTVLEAAA